MKVNSLGICFTNTKPNLPAWGSKVKLGNNLVVFAIPLKENPIVLDMAISQYAFGKIDGYLRKGKSLPYEGGFDQEGNITKDPATILEKEMGLPIGLWKGAGLSLIADIEFPSYHKEILSAKLAKETKNTASPSYSCVFIFRNWVSLIFLRKRLMPSSRTLSHPRFLAKKKFVTLDKIP